MQLDFFRWKVGICVSIPLVIRYRCSWANEVCRQAGIKLLQNRLPCDLGIVAGYNCFKIDCHLRERFATTVLVPSMKMLKQVKSFTVLKKTGVATWETARLSCISSGQKFLNPTAATWTKEIGGSTVCSEQPQRIGTTTREASSSGAECSILLSTWLAC